MVSFIGAFESTYLPSRGIDVAEATQHYSRWFEDVDLLVQAGVTSTRYPMRWHRIESEPGVYDWTSTDRELEHLRALGIEPIVDFVHHTSYPAWLSDGFRDRRFAPAYLAYVEAAARRYPWMPAYTLFNEPFATLFLAGHEALWPPYDRGMHGFVRLVSAVLPAMSEASGILQRLIPDARHYWIDTCESHVAEDAGSTEYASLANDRRHVLLDLALGRPLDRDRPFLQEFIAAGGEPLLDLEPLRVDVLGLDYYCHSEWSYTVAGACSPSRVPQGFANLAEHYGDRYGLPMILAETNVRGLPSDRASWLRYMLEQYELAVSRGVDLRGFCWFPVVDSCDWDSLLARAAGRVDPVGVVSVAPDGSREHTVFTTVWQQATSGAASRDLPAYQFQSPCDTQLRWLLPQLSHWDWQDPPPADDVPPLEILSLSERAS